MGLWNSWRSAFRRCAITSEWNVEGGRQYVDVAGLSGFRLLI